MKKLITVKDLYKYFEFHTGEVLKAVDGVSFDIFEGETLGLVGESGSGKSTLGRTVTGIYDRDSGDITYSDQNIDEIKRKDLAKHSQVIFQDPYASLNPRMTVSEIISEGLHIHYAKGIMSLFKNVETKTKREIQERVYELLKKVGLNKEHANRFPHEFSGGQRQRIGIARALAVNPKFIVCDEPISALDVSIQAQIVNLLKKIQKEEGLTYLFVSHDLSMVRYISDRIAVMYRGKIVEIGDADQVCFQPKHEYTKKLLAAAPKVDLQ